jgi:RNA polymerase sigma-70 factor (ECF subfamily)
MDEARSDEELMMEVASGSLGAFSTLVERHHQRVLNIAFGMTSEPETSRDVAQEVFMRILKHAAMYTPRAKFTTFLYTVVRNIVIEGGRKRARRGEVALAEVHAPDAPASDSVDDEVERLELRQKLAEALAALPPELREAFVLSEIEGLRYQDIAEICSCPEGTVASRKHKAIERLREMLDEFRPGEEK